MGNFYPFSEKECFHFSGAHEPQDGVNGNQHVIGKPGIKDVGITAKLQLEEIYSLKNKKIRDSSSGKK